MRSAVCQEHLKSPFVALLWKHGIKNYCERGGVAMARLPPRAASGDGSLLAWPLTGEGLLGRPSNPKPAPFSGPFVFYFCFSSFLGLQFLVSSFRRVFCTILPR